MKHYSHTPKYYKLSQRALYHTAAKVPDIFANHSSPNIKADKRGCMLQQALEPVRLALRAFVSCILTRKGADRLQTMNWGNNPNNCGTRA